MEQKRQEDNSQKCLFIKNKEMKNLLPQANDLEKVISVFVYSLSKNNCTKKDIADYLNFELRQADYYLNACCFLDLIDEKGEATDIGKEILKSKKNIKEKVFQQVIINPFISKIFAFRLFNSHEDSKEFAHQLAYNDYPGYSQSVLNRRSESLLGWCEYIIEYIHRNI